MKASRAAARQAVAAEQTAALANENKTQLDRIEEQLAVRPTIAQLAEQLGQLPTLEQIVAAVVAALPKK